MLTRPGALLGMALAVIVAFGIGLKGVVKDPSVDAFVPHDHRFALARDEAREVFGLDDPIILALASVDGESLFTVPALETLQRIDAAVRKLPDVKKNDVKSLASEKAIWGEAGDLAVESIIPPGAITPDTAAQAAARFAMMPMLEGLLGSANGDLLTVIIPVEDPNHSDAVYSAVKAIAAAEASPDVAVHVAGVAAMNARLAEIVDSDTRIFIPIAVLTVLVIVFVALRSFKALIGPLVVIAGAAAIAIGTMGWLDARYYLITTALPVVIMAIAVADSLHISTVYLSLRERDPSLSAREAIIMALRRTFVPVTLTSVTTVAGFIGLSFGAAMKPITEFGLFAAVGVTAAWVLSLTALPAIIILTNLAPARRTLQAPDGQAQARPDAVVDTLIGSLSRTVAARPLGALAGMAVFTLVLGIAASRAEFDYERKRYFAPGDAILASDEALNTRLGGINFLDVVVTAPQEGGLMTPQALQAIQDLRVRMAAIPHVAGVSGIDTYVSVMHAALTDAPSGALPEAARAPAQYMFLYEASAPPDDFRQEIDYTQTRALVRARLDTDSYRLTKPVVEALERDLAQWSAQSGLGAQLSGRVAVNDGWMSQLAANHFRGLGLALILVFACTLALFRNLAMALLAMVPVGVGVLAVYATMGAFRIDIAPATSMTAAIATGLGVDFGIHLISHIRHRLAAGLPLSEAIAGEYTLIARACFFSAVALGVALAAICLSSAPPLRWFGLLVSIGAFGSLVGALLIIPGLFALGGLFPERRLQNG
jgi:hypothetical protein